MKITTTRTINFSSFLICSGLLAFAYYLEIALHLQPCPLCVVERFIFALLAFIFLIAALHNPSSKGQKIYGSLTLLLALSGMFFAGRHIWLQSQPSALGEICIPGVSYLLQSLPLSQALKTILLGSSDCSKVGWSFLGLSIPGWTFFFFDVFALIGLSLIKGFFNKIKQIPGFMGS